MPTIMRLGLVGIILFSVFGGPAARAAPVTLAVVTSDTLPGFRQEAVTPYLATRLESTYLANWHFMPGGARHLVSAEVRLYRGGQYQTLLFG